VRRGLVVTLVASAPLLAAAAARAEEPVAPTFSDVAAGGNAEATYEAAAFVIIRQGMNGVVKEDGSSWYPVRGLVYRLAVERDVFFDAVGRPDLSAAFHQRRTAGRSLKALGYLASVGGVVGGLWAFGTNHSVLGIAGLGSVAGGIACIEIGDVLLEPSYPGDRAAEMAAAYNRLLRARLGLPPASPRPLSVALAPLLLPGGGGLGVGGRF
jgi:hypothetical protein